MSSSVPKRLSASAVRTERRRGIYYIKKKQDAEEKENDVGEG